MLIDDADTITNDLAEDEIPASYEDQTLDKTDAKMIGAEPPIKQYI